MVALALARELAPVLASVVVTARAGSTMASELGTMRVTEQSDGRSRPWVSVPSVPRRPACRGDDPGDAAPRDLLRRCRPAWSYVVAVVWQGIDPGVFLDRIDQLLRVSDLWMLVDKSWSSASRSA